MFFRGSRYESVPEAEWHSPDGRVIRYKRRRITPEIAAPLGVTVRDGDRTDLLAWRALGDSELYWQLCDASRVIEPADLAAAPGAVIGVPGPEGTGA